MVRTPLQCFNAIEARDRFHAGENNILLAYCGSKADHNLIRQLQGDEWSEVRYKRFSGITKRLYGWQLKRWLSKLPPIDTLYIGLISHLPLHIANTLQPSRLRLLDDGNETLLFARRIKELRESHKTPSPRLLDKLLALNIDRKILLNAEFFSMFDTSIYGIPHINNDYRVFRNRVKALEERNEVMFIGSNLIGTYFRDEAAFLKRLERVKSFFSDRKLTYCPHRYESRELRLKIAKLGFELFEPSTIMEHAFLSAGWRPALLASFRSTAVDTLGLIYGIPGCMLEVSSNDIVTEGKWKEMQSVWHDYKLRGGNVIADNTY